MISRLRSFSAGCLLAPLVAAILSGCRDDSGSADSASDPGGASAAVTATAPIAVETVVIAAAPFATTIRATGVVVAARDIWLAAENGGRVVERCVDPGATVAASTPLLRLDPEPAEIAIAQAEAALAAARAQADAATREWERLQTLHQSGDITDSARDSADLARRQSAAAVGQAEAGLRAARRALREATLRAPWPAHIAQVTADVGATIAPGYPVLHLLSADSPRIALGLPARDLATLAVGDSAVFELIDPPHARGRACLRSVSAAPDPTTRTYALELDLAPPLPAALRVGMAARVTLPGAVVDAAISIPLRALVVRRGESYAFVAVDGHAEKRALTLAERSAGRVRVERGLRPGDALIVVGQSELLDGSPITVRRAAARSASAPAPAEFTSAPESTPATP